MIKKKKNASNHAVNKVSACSSVEFSYCNAPVVVAANNLQRTLGFNVCLGGQDLICSGSI